MIHYFLLITSWIEFSSTVVFYTNKCRCMPLIQNVNQNWITQHASTPAPLVYALLSLLDYDSLNNVACLWPLNKIKSYIQQNKNPNTLPSTLNTVKHTLKTIITVNMQKKFLFQLKKKKKEQTTRKLCITRRLLHKNYY